MRHEILNEENHTLVYEDILNFFLRKHKIEIEDIKWNSS